MELHRLIEEIDPNLKKNDPSYKKLVKSVKFLQEKSKILFLTTSSRGEWVIKNLDEEPKSTKLAKAVQNFLGKSKCTLLEVPKLKIYPCEGNVSNREGNTCGILKSKLKDKEKNPSGHHRCWASINNSDDELWKISKVLLESEVVIFWGSVRWGQMNAEYQKLIERLTWLENRKSTLQESNILKNISCGVIAIGQNWRGKEVVEVQKQVLTIFGFDIKDELFWNWQYTDNYKDERQISYKTSPKVFDKTFELE